MLNKIVFILILVSSFSVPVWAQKDPTRPATSTMEQGQESLQNQSQGLSLDAIMVTNKSRIAIINGIAVGEGESHLGAKIIKVANNSIIVEQEIDGISQQRTIRVNATGEIKKNATNNF